LINCRRRDFEHARRVRGGYFYSEGNSIVWELGIAHSNIIVMLTSEKERTPEKQRLVHTMKEEGLGEE
jgi:hypothetical protein